MMPPPGPPSRGAWQASEAVTVTRTLAGIRRPGPVPGPHGHRHQCELSGRFGNRTQCQWRLARRAGLPECAGPGRSGCAMILVWLCIVSIVYPIQRSEGNPSTGSAITDLRSFHSGCISRLKMSIYDTATIQLFRLSDNPYSS